jgi:hypothetical protein
MSEIEPDIVWTESEIEDLICEQHSFADQIMGLITNRRKDLKEWKEGIYKIMHDEYGLDENDIQIYDHWFDDEWSPREVCEDIADEFDLWTFDQHQRGYK